MMLPSEDGFRTYMAAILPLLSLPLDSPSDDSHAHGAVPPGLSLLGGQSF